MPSSFFRINLFWDTRVVSSCFQTKHSLQHWSPSTMRTTARTQCISLLTEGLLVGYLAATFNVPHKNGQGNNKIGSTTMCIRFGRTNWCDGLPCLSYVSSVCAMSNRPSNDVVFSPLVAGFFPMVDFIHLHSLIFAIWIVQNLSALVLEVSRLPVGRLEYLVLLAIFYNSVWRMHEPKCECFSRLAYLWENVRNRVRFMEK